jgi:hypothetical protein
MQRETRTEMLIDKIVGDRVTDNTRIIEIAKLAGRVERGDDTSHLKTELSELSRLDPPGGLLVMIVLKILCGKPYSIASANPETIKRCRSLASDLGATIEENADDPRLKEHELTGMMSLVLWPPTPPASDDLMRLFQFVKDKAESYFLKDGEIVPRFFLEFERDGGNGTFAEVACPWGTNAEKRAMVVAIKEKMKERGPLLRYCHVAEVWVAGGPGRPSESPDRTEHLMIVAEERNALPLGGMFEIKRHALSPMPTLGNWSDYSGGEMRAGPLFDLFNNDGPAAEGTLQ